VITAGPPNTYTVLKPLQKFLHDILRKHPVFQLLGDPIPTEQMLYSQQLDLLNPGEALNSGDYDDATNEMYSWVSEIVAKQIATEIKLDSETKELFLKALIGHVLDGKDQLHGSLMGSIVNFIVLCTSNAALCRFTMEQDTLKEVKLVDARLLINGDDCLFPISERGVHLWSYYGRVMGLKVNRAKSFWSREFCNINSRDFTLKISNQPDEYYFHKVKFVNVGLLYGMKRSETSGIEQLADPKYTLGARARTLINDAPYDLHRTLMSKFIEHHPTLTQTGLPWHIPEWAGGVGLPDVITEIDDIDQESWNVVKYKRDLSGLKYIMLNWNKEHPKAVHDYADLDVHNYVTARLKPYVTNRIRVVGSESRREDNIYDTLYKLCCIEWLFDYNHGQPYLNEVEKGAGSGRGLALQIVRHNEALWNKVLKLPNLPKADARTWDILKTHLQQEEVIVGERGELYVPEL